jgi:rhodanese-related sulfurtransferase
MNKHSEGQRFPTISAEQVRADLLAKREIALLDVREEANYAEGHPLFAANLPLSRIEMEAYSRLPRRDVRVVLFDDGAGLAVRAALVLSVMGYTQLQLLEDGLQGWRDAGFELFQDVNSPSKAFGELVEATVHTPSLTAPKVLSMIENNSDCVILDVRRYDEFQTMSIPTAVSVPGAELVLRIQEMAPRPETQVIINCAGRTRSIIGTQSLINAGIPNPVAALRNGTIGWKLADQSLQHGATARFRDVNTATQELAKERARAVVDRAGVKPMMLNELREMVAAKTATVYRFDVRTPEEFLAGHISGFSNAPGGQLVQETDIFAPVRGAQIVLADDDGVRANMTASWLAQMGWRVAVLDPVTKNDFVELGPSPVSLPPLPSVGPDRWMSPEELSACKNAGETVVLDFATAREYDRGHIPGAWYALRSRMEEALERTGAAKAYVLTSPDGVTAQFALRDLLQLTEKPVYLLRGGTAAWQAASLPLDHENRMFASEPVDRYRRPYEGTEIPPAVMQSYLDWEYGLVAQLERDGTHGFWVLDCRPN